MMGLKDFDKLENVENENVEKKDKSKILIKDEIKLEEIEYYLTHIDELIGLVKSSHYDYVNAKLKYDFRKHDYQTNINWNEENALRKTNDLPKISNQDQRNAVIELKLKPLHIKMKELEMKYKFYKKIFDFINHNYDLLCKSYEKSKN